MKKALMCLVVLVGAVVPASADNKETRNYDATMTLICDKFTESKGYLDNLKDVTINLVDKSGKLVRITEVTHIHRDGREDIQNDFMDFVSRPGSDGSWVGWEGRGEKGFGVSGVVRKRGKKFEYEEASFDDRLMGKTQGTIDARRGGINRFKMSCYKMGKE